MEATLNSVIALLQAGNIVDARRIAEAGGADDVVALLAAGNRVDALKAAEAALAAL